MICVLSHYNGSIPIQYIPMHFRIGNWPFSKLNRVCMQTKLYKMAFV